MRTVGKSILQPRSIAVFILLNVLIAVGFVPPAGATGTLDQQQPLVDNGHALNGPGSSAQSLAQTFTAGVTGALDQVDLFLSHQPGTVAPLIVEIRNVSAGAPGSIVLATATVPADSVPTDPPDQPGFVAVPFPVPAPVVAGTQFAIVVYNTSVTTQSIWWFCCSGTDPYAGGNGFFSSASPPTTWSSEFGLDVIDFAFKTYVTPLVPPEADKKVVICHNPGTKNEKSIEVSVNALPAHLAHGDTLGPCS